MRLAPTDDRIGERQAERPGVNAAAGRRDGRQPTHLRSRTGCLPAHLTSAGAVHIRVPLLNLRNFGA